jgi:NAD(P)-dependent dehydrogenase (short-subunit alcohol dehydrogenase family)
MLSGKVAVVTGAGQGIGRGIATALFRKGASIMLADIDGPLVAGVAAELQAMAGTGATGPQAAWARTDVSRQADMVDLFGTVESRFGRVDILVNNAGIITKAPTMDLTEEQFQEVLDVNLKGVLFGSQQAAKAMLRHGKGGSIVNIASVAAHTNTPETAAYSVSKSAVLALTRVMAVEWGRHNIRVNSISPTGIETRMGLQLKQLDPEGFARRLLRVPLPRAAQVDDVANAAVFLASDESSYITGRDILIDGGLLLQNPGFVS